MQSNTPRVQFLKGGDPPPTSMYITMVHWSRTHARNSSSPNSSRVRLKNFLTSLSSQGSTKPPTQTHNTPTHTAFIALWRIFPRFPSFIYPAKAQLSLPPNTHAQTVSLGHCLPAGIQQKWRWLLSPPPTSSKSLSSPPNRCPNPKLLLGYLPRRRLAGDLTPFDAPSPWHRRRRRRQRLQRSSR